MADPWLSVEEAAEYAGVIKDAVYSWVSKRGMPGYLVAHFWKFKRDEGDASVRAGGVSGGASKVDSRRGRQ